MSKEVWGYHEHPQRREPDWDVNPQTAAVREGLARSGFGETSEALYLNSGFTYADHSPMKQTTFSIAVFTTQRLLCLKSDLLPLKVQITA
jgi:hypothetical protein